MGGRRGTADRRYQPNRNAGVFADGGESGGSNVPVTFAFPITSLPSKLFVEIKGLGLEDTATA
jgi:hypothetical protein